MRGAEQCTEASNVDSAPALPMLAEMAMVSNALPRKISDREYQIRVENTGSEWGPISPIYMTIETTAENAGKCTFTPQ